MVLKIEDNQKCSYLLKNLITKYLNSHSSIIKQEIICIETKRDSDQNAIEKWERVYSTYADEVIEIAIKKPFNLVKTVEKSGRSSTS